MGRILTVLGFLLVIFSATRVWASIHMVGLNQDYTGFSKDPLFANMPALISAIIALLALLTGIIRKPITQMLSLVFGSALLGWAAYQYYDKAKYFAVQDGFELHMGLYLHALAPLLMVIGAFLTLRSLKR